MPPKGRSGRGKFLPDVDVAARRNDSARLRSQGVTLQAIADLHWNGDKGTANREIKRFWADQPKETVEEIRSAVLAKLDGLEQDVRRVMAKRHYVVAEGRIVVHHNSTCERILVNGGDDRCSCPKLVDDKPIYDGVAQVRALVETQLKLIPGLAAPKRMEVLTDDAVADEIERARAELAAELAAAGEPDGAAPGDAAGAAGAASSES